MRMLGLLLAVLALAHTARAVVIGAAVIPHGDFALDPSLVNYENGSLELHYNSLKLGHKIVDLKPDIIFLSSPHAIAHQRDFLIYQNTNGSGSLPSLSTGQ